MRVGMGYDVHKLVEGRKLILGGVEIPYEKGLLGHFRCGCYAACRNGCTAWSSSTWRHWPHFPDTDPKYKGASSIKLLEHVRRTFGREWICDREY
mgnify:CR=1 FL=1